MPIELTQKLFLVFFIVFFSPSAHWLCTSAVVPRTSRVTVEYAWEEGWQARRRTLSCVGGGWARVLSFLPTRFLLRRAWRFLPYVLGRRFSAESVGGDRHPSCSLPLRRRQFPSERRGTAMRGEAAHLLLPPMTLTIHSHAPLFLLPQRQRRNTLWLPSAFLSGARVPRRTIKRPGTACDSPGSHVRQPGQLMLSRCGSGTNESDSALRPAAAHAPSR
jgi:hypothetical protein